MILRRKSRTEKDSAQQKENSEESKRSSDMTGGFDADANRTLV